MNNFLDHKQILSSRADIAKFLGLKPDARRRDISSAFGRATHCDAWMELKEDPIMTSEDEYWEVKILNDQPRCRIYLRAGARGSWQHDDADVPQDVLKFFEARMDRNGSLVSNRSWRSWERLDWARKSGRRLKGKRGEIHASVIIPEVSRPTGEIQSTLLIEPIGAPYPDQIEPVRLDLPVLTHEIGQVLENIRDVFQDQLRMAQ